MNKVKKTCNATLCCKATAALKKQVAEDLEKEDKPIQELLDDKQPEDEK
tara:strand:+ start:3795 stop:3941 length:147 start_codon:yes stop_codon:yes gene_type:complete